MAWLGLAWLLGWAESFIVFVVKTMITPSYFAYCSFRKGTWCSLGASGVVLPRGAGGLTRGRAGGGARAGVRGGVAQPAAVSGAGEKVGSLRCQGSHMCGCAKTVATFALRRRASSCSLPGAEGPCAVLPNSNGKPTSSDSPFRPAASCHSPEDTTDHTQ